MAPRQRRPQDYLEAVGRRLRVTRLALGATAAELCQEIDARPKAYSQWENGKRLFDVLAAVRLKERYGVTLDWIYGGDMSGLSGKLARQVREIERLSGPPG